MRGKWFAAGAMLLAGMLAVAQTQPAAQETINKLNAELAAQQKKNAELQAKIDQLKGQLGGDARAPDATPATVASKPATSKPATLASKPAASTSRPVVKTDADIEKALQKIVAEATADKGGLEKVISSLRDSQGINIVVNWTALQQDGIDKNTPVTLNLKNVTLEKILQTVFSEAGARMAYGVSDGVLSISTTADIDSKTSGVKTYDIRRLLNGKPMPGAVDELTDIIKKNAVPDTWRDNGGTIGAISYSNGTLIITQCYRGHKAVADLLAKMR